jgi:D-alanyl-D-alanine carboxypeptidase
MRTYVYQYAVSLWVLGSLLVPQITFAAPLSQKWKNLISEVGFDLSKQSACVSDTKGKILFSHNETLSVVPASVSKVYTTDFVLSQMDKDFRFKTDFVVFGNTLYINGDADPFFIDAHLVMVLNRISRDYKKGTIKYVVFNNFYMNWSTFPSQTMIHLKKTLQTYDIISKNVRISQSVIPRNVSGSLYRFSSIPLVQSLRQMNIYSTNSASELLFSRLGGVPAFQVYMKKTYGVGSDVVSFQTGSGLDGNKTTCALTLKVMKHLDEQLKKQELTFKDVLPVPVIDGGSMTHRMKNIVDKRVLLVKPGFVYNHETLTGVIHTLSGDIYFAIFTEYPHKNITRPARVLIDTFTQKLIEQYKGVPFEYLDKPKTQVKGISVERVK